MTKTKMKWAAIRAIANMLIALVCIGSGIYLICQHEQVIMLVIYCFFGLSFAVDSIKNIFEYKSIEEDYLVEENQRLDEEIKEKLK